MTPDLRGFGTNPGTMTKALGLDEDGLQDDLLEALAAIRRESVRADKAEAMARKLAAAGGAYIAYRDRRLRLWEAVANCGHEAGSDCPEFRAVQEDADITEDGRLDDAIRAALARFDAEYGKERPGE